MSPSPKKRPTSLPLSTSNGSGKQCVRRGYQPIPAEQASYKSASSRKASQCRGCGTLAAERIREQAESDKPVAAAISRSEKPSSFGAISRLNQASSRWPGCSRAQLRLRRCPSLIASPRTRFTAALRRGSLPAALCAARALRAPAIARRPCSRRAFGMHASQCRRLRLRTGSPHIAHAIGLAGRASMVRVRHFRVAYGRGCEALRGVASSGDRCGPGTLRRLFLVVAASVRGVAHHLASDSRNACARRAAIGRRHSRQCGSVSASSCVSGAAMRHIPFGSSPKSRAVNVRSSSRSSRKPSTSPRTPPCIQRERIAIPLIGVHAAHLRIAAVCKECEARFRLHARKKVVTHGVDWRGCSARCAG